MHLGAVLGFGTMAPLFGLGAPYWVGVVLLATVLVVEQVMAAYRKANLPLAFLTLNGVISIIFFMCLVADRLAA